MLIAPQIKNEFMVKCNVFALRQTTRFSTVVILLSIVEVCWAIYTPVRAQDNRAPETIALPSAYWDAVEDARVAEADEIFRNLTAITPDNKALTWDDNGRVLVATWTTWDGYTQTVGNQLILTQDLWVTAVPDLKNFCKNYTPTAETPLADRLNQLLGLPPDTADRAAKRQMVEIWVAPQFLFRPSPDPEITDHEAELSFRPLNEFISVSLSYQHWFYEQYSQRYQYNSLPITRDRVNSAHPPYPWTQLGYTYDWGNFSDWTKIDQRRPEHVGVSEFVIRQWSPIAVHTTQSVEDYCQKAN